MKRTTRTKAQRLQHVIEPGRKTRDQNNGQYDGPNRDTSLTQFMREIHRVADKPKRQE